MSCSVRGLLVKAILLGHSINKMNNCLNRNRSMSWLTSKDADLMGFPSILASRRLRLLTEGNNTEK